MASNDEQKIIKRVLKGDRAAFAEIVEAYKGPVYKLAFSMTGSRQDADDLAQDVFLKVYTNLSMYDPDKRFFPWLYTIALNTIRNHLKKHKRDMANESDDLALANIRDQTDSPESAAEKDEEADRLYAYLDRLPVKLREAVILRYIQDLPFEDVALVLGVTLSGAKMRVYRGLEQLKGIFEKEGVSVD